MKTRRAKQILKSVSNGTAIYPRHILRAAGSQLMRCIPIGGFDNCRFHFWPCGPIACHVTLGRWIPDAFVESVKVARAIGVPVETNDLNGTKAWITPHDTAESAYNRWNEGKSK